MNRVRKPLGTVAQHDIEEIIRETIVKAFYPLVDEYHVLSFEEPEVTVAAYKP